MGYFILEEDEKNIQQFGEVLMKVLHVIENQQS